MSRRRLLRGGAGGALLATTVAMTGCEIGEQAVSARCTHIGEQCQLPDGPLGVCQERPCEAGHAAPCFTCTSQH